MKLVLLPGMDGTGLLFEPLLPELSDLGIEIISLPDQGPQDYAALAACIAPRLEGIECVLVAESFSGGIVGSLLNDHRLHIRHVVFVASFLVSPSRVLSRLASFLPIRALAFLPILSPLIIRFFLLGRGANGELLATFRRSLALVSSRTLRARLRQISKLRSTGQSFHVGATYIRPLNDFLVGDQIGEFRQAYPDIDVVELAGPHFILQAEPKVCARLIRDAVGHLTSTGSGTPSAPLL
ncbi:alpha/beta fold hydrolase [Marinobacter nitratireducens]|uniref:alpha/beta fold hydrolase n=1 Tax=Marinobacter nitratireducens TaxID=1137280 RepID=UPI00056AF37A|nr:alpha/beta fold hydrolase [Marinobacter nitratireducens]